MLMPFPQLVKARKSSPSRWSRWDRVRPLLRHRLPRRCKVAATLWPGWPRGRRPVVNHEVQEGKRFSSAPMLTT